MTLLDFEGQRSRSQQASNSIF